MGSKEEVLAVYRHHWFAYASILFIAIFAVTIFFSLVAVLIVQGGEGNMVAKNKEAVLAGALLLSVVVLLSSLLPIWLRSKESLVLSDDALYQTLQPNVFASKISQLNLIHVNDVTSRQDFFGTIFGYGHITVETPGEQDNYEFFTLPNANDIVREIIEAHENFQAALETGRIPTTFRNTQTPAATGSPSSINVDPKLYKEFLAFQQMKAQQTDMATTKMQPQSTAQAAQPSLIGSPDTGDDNPRSTRE